MIRDNLDILLETQRKFQETLGYNFETMTPEQRAAYIKEYAQHMDHEAHEMLSEIPFFKAWKKYPEEDFVGMFNKAREEWIDVLHFFLNVSLALGFDSRSMAAMYSMKHECNHKRQIDTEHYKKCLEE